MGRELSAEQKLVIVEHLVQHLQADSIILFGSAAKGNMRPDSDVDVAFMTETEFDAYRTFLVAQELADRLGREVDLIDFREASTVFKAQIVGHGHILHDNKPVQRQYAFMHAFKAYAMLNEERQVILDNLGGGSRHDR